jgi:Spy/CpxP family protein refolding chaperone
LIAVFLLGGSLGMLTYHLSRSGAQTVDVTKSGQRDPRTRPRIEQVLQLSPEQLNQFKEITQEFRPKFEELRAAQEKKYEAIRAEMSPQYDAIRSEMDSKIFTILKADQKQKFDTFLKERSDKMGGRHRPDHLPPPDNRK